MTDPTLEASIREALQCCSQHPGEMPVEPRIDDLAPRLVSLFEKREAGLREERDRAVRERDALRDTLAAIDAHWSAGNFSRRDDIWRAARAALKENS